MEVGTSSLQCLELHQNRVLCTGVLADEGQLIRSASAFAFQIFAASILYYYYYYSLYFINIIIIIIIINIYIMNKNREIFQAAQYEHSESRFTDNMILLVVVNQMACL